jgi:hypothetical protein
LKNEPPFARRRYYRGLELRFEKTVKPLKQGCCSDLRQQRQAGNAGG